MKNIRLRLPRCVDYSSFGETTMYWYPRSSMPLLDEPTYRAEGTLMWESAYIKLRNILHWLPSEGLYEIVGLLDKFKGGER